MLYYKTIGTDQIMYCIVALILGMLLANMLKSVCGCKVVEGHTGGACTAGADGNVCQHDGSATGGDCGCDCEGTGYSGTNCQTADACTAGADGNVCQHAGSATGVTGDCGCDCLGTGYSGANCQTADACTAGAGGNIWEIVCQHGGEVTGVTGDCGCDCGRQGRPGWTGYSGTNCQTLSGIPDIRQIR